MARSEPFGKFRFDVEVDGVVGGGFQKVGGLVVESEVTAFQEGGRNDGMVKLPGQGQVGAVTLRRGVVADRVMLGWVRQGGRRTVDLILRDDAGREVVRYTLLRAWASKWEMEDLDGSASEVAVEMVEVAHEGVLRSAGAAPGRPTAPGGRPAGSGGGLAGRLQSARDDAPGGRFSDAVGAAARHAQDGVGVIAAVQAARRSTEGRARQAGGLAGGWGALRGGGGGPPGAGNLASDVGRYMSEGRSLAGQAQRARNAPGSVAAEAAGADSVVAAAGSARGQASRTAAAGRGAPAGAANAGRAFVRSGGGGGGGDGAWSDGVDAVQSPGGFGEPSMGRGTFA